MRIIRHIGIVGECFNAIVALSTPNRKSTGD